MQFKPKIAEKRWDPSEELKLIELWEREGVGRFREEDLGKKPPFIVDTPPPYPSGAWHIGGAAHYTHHDIIARFRRMMGYNVLLPFYADRNGLPIEVYVEKTLGVNPHEMASTPEGREKFLQLCRERLDETEEQLVRIWRRVGCSYEYWRNGTDSEEYRRLTQATFIELWKRGLVYEAERPVNWCPRCRTTLSDAEIEYEEREGSLYYIKFRIKETGEDAIVATTRPELLAGCRALIYNPDDERYKHLEGKHALAPLYGHELKIIPHPQADPRFGTGLVMICSYGDQTDVRLFRELRLEPTVLMDERGIMNEKAGPLKGLPVDEARRRVVQLLEEKGLLVDKKPLRHSVPTCWRCHTRIEYIHVREYFLKQLEFKEKLKQVVDQMEFYPEFHKQKLLDWIDSIASDWPISRSRYYATEIPVWRCRSCGAVLLPQPGRYYRPWRDPPPWDSCPKCGAPREMLEGEKKVFDTWFDSSISPLYVTRYMRDPQFYEKVKDHVLRPQGYEIIRTWLYFTILRVYQLTGRPAFRWVKITGMGLDEKGEAMHKSKGNVIPVDPFVEKYGADAFRYWVAASAKTGYDYKVSHQLFRAGQLFATKLWNMARFVSMFPDPGLEWPKLTELDRALLAKINEVSRAYIAEFTRMETLEPANLVHFLAWDVFASNYLETVKSRAYNTGGEWSEDEQRAAWATLHEALRSILKMAAPIMVFVTDALWRRLYSDKSIHEQPLGLPREEWDRGNPGLIDLLMEVNREVWKYKKDNGMKLKDPLPGTLLLPEEARPIARDLAALHKASRVDFYEKPPSGARALGKRAYLSQ